MSDFFEIAYAAVGKRLCLFTGTGFSKALSSNKAPGWQELMEKICELNIKNSAFKKTLFPKGGKNPLQLDEAAQVIAIELLRNDTDLHEEISKLISSISPSGKYEETENFLQERSYRIVTTNYDKLAEEVAGKDCQSLSPGLPIPRRSSRVKAFHVHGSIDVPSRMVVTADDYFNFMSSDSYFSRKLSTVLHENTVVILGYSLGDTNLKAILNDYRGFVRSHTVGYSIFLVSRDPVDQRVSDYYSSCYGIRVIDQTEIEGFFKKVNASIPEAEKCLEKSIKDIDKVVHQKHQFTEKFLKIESSFYQVVAAIGAIGVSLEKDTVVETFADIISKKMNLASETGAWEQYVQLASWLTYLGGLIEVRGSAIEMVFLKAVKFSMERMSKKQMPGYSWHAYKIWDARWRNVGADNRILIAKYIIEMSVADDALEIISR